MTVRLAYMHRSFPGIFASLVGYVAAQNRANAVFLAEKWARDVHIPGVRRARIPGLDPEQVQKSARGQSPEARMAEMARNAAKAGDTLLRLRKGGFVPDVLYATADEGYVLYAKDIFPKARLVVRLGSFYSPEVFLNAQEMPSFAPQGTLQTAMGRVQNCMVLAALHVCDMAVVTSSWQMQMFSSTGAQHKMRMIPSGVDTRMFSPATHPPLEEVVTFACQGINPARGIHLICQCLPFLLAQRPQCKARILSFAPSRTEASKQQHEASLRQLLPVLSDEQKRRVEIVISPQQNAYVELLRQSTAYVYLTAPTMLSAGILEAMSCGTLVIASSTGPVRELVQHEENGFLCDTKDAATLADQVAQVLGKAKDLAPVGRHARETVVREHDLHMLLPKHADLILNSESHF